MEPKMEDHLYEGFREGFEETARGWAGDYSTSQAHHEQLTYQYASDLAHEAVRILTDLGVEVS